MPLFALLLAFAQDGTPPESADAAICDSLQKYERAHRDDYPEMVDEVTRADRLVVDCVARSVTFYKTLIGDPANLVEGWDARQRDTWNEAVCGSETFRAMVGQGWRFRQHYTFPDDRVVHYEASCG